MHNTAPMSYNAGKWFRPVDRQPRSNVSPYHHYPPSSIYFARQPIPDPVFGRPQEYFRNQMDARELVRRQLEKERIREEIIAQEIAQRRILEAEVRMELMREREAAMRMGDTLRQQPEERSLEERIVRLLEERLGVGSSGTRMAARAEIGRSHMVPFHERSIESWTSEVPFKQRSMETRRIELKPPSERHNVERNILEVIPSSEHSKERIVFKAKPDKNVSGVKRKAGTPPEAVISSELPTVSAAKKKVKDEWSCAICQVSATSEHGLTEHLQGKKHKSKEAGLKAQTNGKNFSIGLLPKKPKNVNFVEMADDARSKNVPSLQIDHIADDSKKKNVALVQNKEKGKVKQKKNFKFWCEHCKKGAFTEKVMVEHKKGKKHLFWVQKMKCDGTAAMENQVDAGKANDNAEGASKDCKSTVSNNLDCEMTDDGRSKGNSLHTFSMMECPEGNDAPSLQIDHIADDSKDKIAALIQKKGKIKMNDNAEETKENIKKGALFGVVMEKKDSSELQDMKCESIAAMVTKVNTSEKGNDNTEGRNKGCEINVSNSHDCEMTDDARPNETSLRVFSIKECPKDNDAPSLQIDHTADDSVLVQKKGKTKVNDDAEGANKDCENTESNNKDCEMIDDAFKETSSRVFSMMGPTEGNDSPSLQTDYIADDDSKKENSVLFQNTGKTVDNKMTDDAMPKGTSLQMDDSKERNVVRILNKRKNMDESKEKNAVRFPKKRIINLKMMKNKKEYKFRCPHCYKGFFSESEMELHQKGTSAMVTKKVNGNPEVAKDICKIEASEKAMEKKNSSQIQNIDSTADVGTVNFQAIKEILNLCGC